MLMCHIFNGHETTIKLAQGMKYINIVSVFVLYDLRGNSLYLVQVVSRRAGNHNSWGTPHIIR